MEFGWAAYYVGLCIPSDNGKVAGKAMRGVATLFPNEASLFRLVGHVLVEITEDWETARTHLRMDAE